MVKKGLKLIVIAGLLFLVSILPIAGCGAKKADESPQSTAIAGHPRVQMEMQDGGKMVFELYPEYAPATVENFLNLAKSGFYDGLKFHRIVKGFMAQGGDPKGDGTGGSGKSIKGEFAENGFKQNTLKHTRGVISMARSGNPNSASSQFFIMDGENSSLDGKYAAFGKLTEGDEVLKKITDTPVGPNPRGGEVSVPKTDVVIKKVTILGY